MRIFLITTLFALTTAAMAATFDLTADAMRDIEDAAKSLDSNVSLQKGDEAAAEARQITEFFKQVEGYYAAKGDKPDAVGFARKTAELAAQTLAAVDAKDFDKAGEAVSGLTRSCKTCHQVYKNR